MNTCLLLLLLFSLILAAAQVRSRATRSGKEFRRLHPHLRTMPFPLNQTSKKRAVRHEFSEQRRFRPSHFSVNEKIAGKPRRIKPITAFTTPRHPWKRVTKRRLMYTSRARRMRLSKLWDFLKKHRLNDVNKCRVKKKGPCCKGWIRNQFTGVCMPDCMGSCMHGDCKGKYTCRCHRGFTGPLCGTDVNECASAVCQHGCTNTFGSYRCTCNEGYSLVENGSCEEIKPCEKKNCQYKCYVADGEAKCTCPKGYKISRNGKTCEDIDECITLNIKCSGEDIGQTCRNLPGSYTCTCDKGFFFHRHFKTCQDSNECILEKHNCDVVRGRCINTIGSFKCECSKGYVGDGITCQFNKQCHSEAYFNVTNGEQKCICKPGYQGDGYDCEDVNECETGTHNCHKDYSVCLNFIGQFECRCISGFTGDGETCTRIPTDRVSEPCGVAKELHCHKNAVCEDNGCFCNEGHEGDGYECQDIDECSICQGMRNERVPSDEDKLECCAGKCVNTIGSYHCE